MGIRDSKLNFETKRELIINNYIVYNDHENENSENSLKCKNKKTNKCYELEIYGFKVS